MGITQALQYSSEPTNILLKQTEAARADQKLKEAAALQDEKVRFALPMQLIGVMQNADVDVAQNYAKDYVAQLSAMVKNKDVPNQDVQLRAAEFAADINSRSATVKGFRTNAYKTIESLATQFGAKPENLAAIVNQHILQNLNNPTKLQNGSAFVSGVIAKQPSLYVDNTMGTQLAQSIIKNTPLSKLRTEITTDPNGITSKTIKSDTAVPPWMEAVLDKRGNPTAQLKVDKNGVISDDVFHMFYNYQQKPQDFRMRSWLDAQANHLIDQNNLGKTPETPGYIDPNDEGAKIIAAKQYLGNFLKEATRTEISSINKENTTKARAATGTGGTEFWNMVNELSSIIPTGESKDVNTLAAQYSTAITDIISKNKQTKIGPDGTAQPYSANDLKIKSIGDGKFKIYAGDTELTSFDAGTNARVNVGKAKTASQKASAAPATQKSSAKVWTREEWRNMSKAQRDAAFSANETHE